MTQRAFRDALVGVVPTPRDSGHVGRGGVPGNLGAEAHGGTPGVDPTVCAESVARLRRLQLATLLEHSPQAIVILDADGRVREWNPAAVALLGWDRSELLGGPLDRIIPPADRPVFAQLWEGIRAGGEPHPLSTEHLHRDGSRLSLDTYVVPIVNVGGSFEGMLARLVPRTTSGADMGGPPATAATSASPSGLQGPPRGSLEVDDLTLLPGRRWLQRRLTAPIPAGQQRAVAVLDVDAFALVNQGYGPEVGDDVLRVLATRLARVSGTIDLGRWQADEFVCILDAPDAGPALGELVARLSLAANEPFLVARDQIRMTVSAGLVTSERVSLPELFRSASIALDSAKSRGRDRAVWFDDADAIPADASGLRLANDLQRGIAAGELRLHFQPILELATNHVVGVEALVRWERPGVGLLAPGSFIEVAERTGQIVALGEWVVAQACEAAVQLAGQRLAPLRVNINVSARQLSDPGLVRMLREALTLTECDARNIGIEVTETAVLHDIGAATMVLEDIKALGVHLELDDFGTGYSSLLYLKHFPVDRIKIDMSFVAGLGTNIADTAIVASTIALAHSVGLTAIAEGVETPGQLTLLKQMGCDFAQGYLLSPPLPQHLLEEWLQQHAASRHVRRAAGHAGSGDVAALSRDRIADRRDTMCDRRDDIADDREYAGDRRDAVGEQREHAGDERDLGADHRDRAGDERDHASDLRDVAADDRDRVADERDRAADLREEAAATHLPEVAGSAPVGASGAVQELPGLSATARQEAAADRALALQDRGVDAGVRMLAGSDRDAASTERDAGADERLHASRDRTQARADRAAFAQDRRAAPADPLTGAQVHVVGLARLRDEVATATRHGYPLSVASVAVGGHEGLGNDDDQAMTDLRVVLVANGLGDVLTDADVILRHGSRVFICAFPGMPAQVVTQRLSEVTATMSEPSGLGRVAIGVAELMAPETAEQLIERAHARRGEAVQHWDCRAG